MVTSIVAWTTNFLDPLAFRTDSDWGIPAAASPVPRGQCVAGQRHREPASAMMTRSLYAYIPDIIRFYLSEDRFCQTSRPLT